MATAKDIFDNVLESSPPEETGASSIFRKVFGESEPVAFPKGEGPVFVGPETPEQKAEKEYWRIRGKKPSAASEIFKSLAHGLVVKPSLKVGRTAETAGKTALRNITRGLVDTTKQKKFIPSSEEAKMMFPSNVPWAETTGEILSTLPIFASMAPYTAAARLPAGAPLLSQIVRSGAIGAGEMGAYETLMQTGEDKPMAEKVRDIGIGTGIGGVFGAAVPIIGRAVDKYATKRALQQMKVEGVGKAAEEQTTYAKWAQRAKGEAAEQSKLVNEVAMMAQQGRKAVKEESSVYRDWAKRAKKEAQIAENLRKQKEKNYEEIIKKEPLPPIKEEVPRAPGQVSMVEPVKGGKKGFQIAKDVAARAAKPIQMQLPVRATSGAQGFMLGVEPEYDEKTHELKGFKIDPWRAGAGLLLGSITGKPGNPGKPGKRQFINTERMAIDEGAKAVFKQAGKVLGPVFKQFSKPVAFQEIINKAVTSDVLKKARTREAVVASEGQILKTRQELARMAKSGKITEEFVNLLAILKTHVTNAARDLNALKIIADPSDVVDVGSVQQDIVSKLMGLGVGIDDIVKKSAGVDFRNAEEAAKFYRQFVKPNMGEYLDELRYINMLSSPKTHIVNAFSNLIQAAGLSPATRIVGVGIDSVASKLTGKARERYLSEVPAYTRALINNIPDSAKEALQVLKGGARVERPDVAHMPTMNKWLSYGYFVPRALEAMDVFFRSAIETAEKAALYERMAKKGVPIDESVKFAIEQLARKKGSYWVFRSALDPNNLGGQGYVLSMIDRLTNVMYAARKIPGVGWAVPFLQTPMNIFKQGIEFSPLGYSTMAGAADPVEQAAKASIGSMVFLGGYGLAQKDMITWAAPKGEKERELFYASGRKPYSILIPGIGWVSYSKLGPIAYALAMAAGLKHDSPDMADNTADERFMKTVAGVLPFFADQSYVQGMGDLLDAVGGDERSIARFMASLPQQVTPMSGLLRWVNSMTDHIYRRPSPGIGLKSIYEGYATGMPGLSEGVPKSRTPAGYPSKRPLPYINPFLPTIVSPSDPDYEKQYQMLDRAKTLIKKQQSTKELDSNLYQLLDSIDEAKASGNQEYLDRMTKMVNDPSAFTDREYNRLQELMGRRVAKKDYIGNIATTIKKIEPKARAQFIYEEAQGYATKEEKNHFLDLLAREGVLDDETAAELSILVSGGGKGRHEGNR